MYLLYLYSKILLNEIAAGWKSYKMLLWIFGSHHSYPHWLEEYVLSATTKELYCSISAVLCSRPGIFCCITHTALLVIALSLRLWGYEPEDWHHVVCQAVQMHHVQSSLWSKGLEAKGLAQWVHRGRLFWRAVERRHEYAVVFILGLRVGVCR